MKLIFVFLLFLTSISCSYAQVIAAKSSIILPSKTMGSTAVSFSGIENMDGLPKSVIYWRARNWLVENYHSAGLYIVMDDEESGAIKGQGFIRCAAPYAYSGPGHTINDSLDVEYTLLVYVKDAKYKYEVQVTGVVPFSARIHWPSDYTEYLNPKNGDQLYQTTMKSIVETTNSQLNSKIASLRKGMSTKAYVPDF